jgi:hypothetical protein
MATNDPRPLTRRELSEFLPSQRAIRAFEKLFDLIPSDLIELLAQIDAARNEVANAQSSAIRNLGLIRDLDLRNKGLVFVSSPSDLPLPVSGIITLRDGFTYFFLSQVDLLGSRLEGGQNTTILGMSSENCRIKSTGLALGTALLASAYTTPIRHITLESATIFDLDATGAVSPQALDWYGVNLEGSSDIGTIKNYSNFIAASMAFLGSSGLVFDGTVGTIGFTECLFVGTDPGTIINVPSTAIITRRMRISYSSFVVAGAGVALDVDISASVPVDGYVLDTCNFSGGGVYVQGVQHDDNKARWSENKGVQNSAALTGYYMQGNATPTVIASTSTPVKAAGATTETAISQRFTVSLTNRATYVGAINRDFKVSVVASLSSGNNNQISVYIAKNGVVMSESKTDLTTNAGGRLENGSVQALVSLSDIDYIEVWVENNSSTNNITVEDLNVIIEALN